MDKSHRRGNQNWGLLVFAVLCVVAVLSGCASNGGARIYVKSNCDGLEKLGYSSPFSDQDANDIEALGYPKCASYIRNKINW